MGKASPNTSWLKWAVCLCVPALFYGIPLSEVYTAHIRMFFVITLFVILCVAFDFFEMLIPSILLPTLYFLSGIVPMNVAFGAWTNATVWMVLGALILATVLDECGLLRRIALWCIKKCGGTFTGTLYGVFLAGCVINFITFSNAFIIMMTLTYGICLAMKLERSINSALMCFAGMIGGITSVTFLYNPGYLALGEMGIRAMVPGFSVVWYESIIYNGLLFVMCIGLIFLLTKIYRTKDVVFEGGAEYFSREYASLGPMSVKEKKALFVVLVLMAYLLSSPAHKLPAAYGFMTIPFLLFAPGISVGSYACVKKINFSIIFFIAACLGIGVVSASLGIEKLMSSLVGPVMGGASPLFAFLAMLTLGCLSNLFMTPYAMMAALSLPFAALAVDMGISPLASVMALMISTDMIFMPYEVAGCLLMYSFGLISMGNFVKLYTLKTVLTYVFFIIVMYPPWSLLGLIH